jgi:RecA/RadA recombinase
MPITPDNVLLLLVYLVLSPGVRKSAIASLEPEDFVHLDELHYQNIWRAVRGIVTAHGDSAITISHIQASLSEPEQFTDYQEPAAKASVKRLLEYIYQYDVDSLSESYGQQLLQQFFDERKVIAAIQHGLGVNAAASDILDICTKAYRNTRVQRAAAINIMSPDLDEEEDTPVTPTGVDYLDIMLDGGFKAGATYGLLGPTGGGKTIVAVQLAVAYALSGRKVLFLTYESPALGDIRYRMYACATNISIGEFRNRPYKPEVKEKLKTVQEITAPYLYTLDMSGLDSANASIGHGGAQEVRAYTEDIEPELVIIDWFWPMIVNYGSVRGIPKDKLRLEAMDMIGSFNQLSKSSGINVWVNHQLNTEAGKRGSNYMPTSYEAAEIGGQFSWLLDTCFAISPIKLKEGVEEDGIDIRLSTPKSRSQARSCIVIQRYGSKSKFLYNSHRVVDDDGFVVDDAEVGRIPNARREEQHNTIESEFR